MSQLRSTRRARHAYNAAVARILGIDLGERRIGIAVSTPEGGLAVPYRILEAQGDEADARAIARIADSEGAETIVIGHPKSLSGERGAQARRVEAFAQTLAETTGLKVDLWDERLTSRQAERRPAERRGARRRPKPTDDVAAALVLQAYLDRQRGGRSS